jgi:uncharacterized protein (TIGR01370 family)
MLLIVAGILPGSEAAFGAETSTAAPTVGTFANYLHNGTKDRYLVTQNETGQTLVSYSKKTSWDSVAASVTGYNADYTQLVVTMRLDGVKQVGIEVILPNKATQTLRYADLALTKEVVQNPDGTVTFTLLLSKYANIKANGLSTILLYFDPTTSVSGTKTATITDVRFKTDAVPEPEPPASPASPTTPTPEPPATPVVPTVPVVPEPPATPVPPVLPVPPPPPVAPTVPEPVTSHNPLITINSYACYYGDASAMAKLKTYDLVIIDANSLGGAKRIAELKEAGVIVIAYLTIGEEDTKSTTGKDWYLYDKKGKPLKNGDWSSYYVDARNATWQTKILKDAQVLLNMGADGIFLDTIDTVDLAPETKVGMVELVGRLRLTYPNALLVANRGFSVLDEIAPFIDGVLFEDFSSYYNFSTKKYTAWKGSDLEWTRVKAEWLKKLGAANDFRILTLDYVATDTDSSIPTYKARSLSFGFLPYFAPINLDKVF